MNGAFVIRGPLAGMTVSTAITLLQIKTHATRPIEVLRASLTQKGSVTSVQERIALLRKSAAATVTIAVAGTNVLQSNPNDQAPSVSLGTSATGFNASGEGTNTDVPIEEGFNVLSGWLYLPVPEERLSIPAASFFGMTFLAAPASQLWYPEIVCRELC